MRKREYFTQENCLSVSFPSPKVLFTRRIKFTKSTLNKKTQIGKHIFARTKAQSFVFFWQSCKQYLSSTLIKVNKHFRSKYLHILDEVSYTVLIATMSFKRSGKTSSHKTWKTINFPDEEKLRIVDPWS